MESKQLLIAIGNKARQGKDLFASIFNDVCAPDVYITHWADPLKEEVTNRTRKLPLIYRQKVDEQYKYMLLNYKEPHYTYVVMEQDEVPYLHSIFEKRGINEYKGMDEKDSEILQFWGTNFRRAQDPDYWVNKIMEEIKYRPEKYILIPDTRFKNEYDAVKAADGIYVNVVRINKDLSRFLDDSRDPKHQSEIDLDDIKADMTLTAYSGDLNEFKQIALSMIQSIREL